MDLIFFFTFLVLNAQLWLSAVTLFWKSSLREHWLTPRHQHHLHACPEQLRHCREFSKPNQKRDHPLSLEELEIWQVCLFLRPTFSFSVRFPSWLVRIFYQIFTSHEATWINLCFFILMLPGSFSFTGMFLSCWDEINLVWSSLQVTFFLFH